MGFRALAVVASVALAMTAAGSVRQAQAATTAGIPITWPGGDFVATMSAADANDVDTEMETLSSTGGKDVEADPGGLFNYGSWASAWSQARPGQIANAAQGSASTSSPGRLTTFYNGALPPQYQPMKKQGAIVLGTGGDNSHSDVGSFFEGVMTDGYPTDAAVQANIVAAGYSGSTNPVSAAPASAAGQAVVHDGFSSVYTVDSANGHLQESYLPAMGDGWLTQDLSDTGGTLPGTPPVSVQQPVTGNE